jgi:hypothetical protein
LVPVLSHLGDVYTLGTPFIRMRGDDAIHEAFSYFCIEAAAY